MTELQKYIRADLILPDMDCKHKDEAISRLVQKVFEKNRSDALDGLSCQEILNEVLERENISTTSIGNGLAFPHARLEKCSDLVVAIGICKNPLDFKSLDKKPCEMVCLMISPAHKPYIILQVMAAMTRVLSDRANFDKIKSMSSPGQIAEFLAQTAFTDTRTVFARDIMKPVQKYVTLEDPIEQVARTMHLNHYDVLPVVDENNVLSGQISCLNIFSYGIPDFFNQLQTASFVRYMDPFEKYFKLKKDLKVKDLYDLHTSPISQDATLLEIIFQMAAKNKAELFVVDDGKLVGLIDRFSIIDRILFF